MPRLYVLYILFLIVIYNRPMTNDLIITKQCKIQYGLLYAKKFFHSNFIVFTSKHLKSRIFAILYEYYCFIIILQFWKSLCE